MARYEGRLLKAPALRDLTARAQNILYRASKKLCLVSYKAKKARSN